MLGAAKFRQFWSFVFFCKVVQKHLKSVVIYMTWIFLQISENTTLNKFRKSVNICQSYARMYSGTVYSVFDSLCRKGGSCDALPIESRPMSRQSPVVPGFYYDAHNARHQPTLQIGHWLPLDSATSISTVVRIFWRLVAVSICRFRF